MTICIKCRESDCECGAPTVQPAEPQLDEVKRVRKLLADIKAKKEGKG
jgi:hypothetical protein